MCLPTHKRQPPLRVYGPAPFTETAEPGSSRPARPLLPASAPRGRSSFCHTVPKAFTPCDKSCSSSPVRQPAHRFQPTGQVLHPTHHVHRDGRVHATAPSEKQQPSLGRGFTGANFAQGNLAMDCEAEQGVRSMDRAALRGSAEGIKKQHPHGKKTCLCCGSPSSSLCGLSFAVAMAREQDRVLSRGRAGSARSGCCCKGEQRRHRWAPAESSPCREPGAGRAKVAPGNEGWDKERQTARLQTHSSGCSPAWSLLPSRTKWWWDRGGGFATSRTPWWKQSRVLPMARPWVCAQGLPPSGRNLC